MPRSTRKTGELRLSRHLLVVEDDALENDSREIALSEARKRNPAAQVGDAIAETLPPFDFGRIAAQSAKQVIVQKVRDAERDRQYQEYKDRIGEIVNGVVKRVEYGNVIVDLGRGEAIVRRDELIPRETFRPGDRIRAYLFDVRREARGPQIFLSRTHPQFMAKLFAQEVPEIYDGIVEVKAVARDPGSRAKIAVISRDSSIDPVGACVGMRGSRVQAVVGELQGEKIDIIPWSQDQATFIVNALQPAEVVKVVLDEEADRIEVVVPDDQLSLAIGRRGQNVRLASQLTGWDIDILTEAEESERRQKEFAERTELFMNALDVDEVVGQLLASEGFRSVEELAYVDAGEVASIEGFDEDTAAEIQSRAQDYLARIEAEHEARRQELGVADELKEIDGVTTAMLVALRRERREDGRGSRRLRHRRSRRLDRRPRRRGDPLQGLPRRLRAVPRRGRGHDHGRPRQGGLDRGRRSRDRGIGRRGRDRGSAVLNGRSAFRDRSMAMRRVERRDAFVPRHEPERTCIVTRAARPAAELIRFVLGPDGQVVADLKHKLPGRGVWVTARRDMVEEAVKRRLFARAFKAEVKVRRHPRRGHRDRRCGRICARACRSPTRPARSSRGFAKVESAIAEKPVVALIHAAEAAEDGRRKLANQLRKRLGEAISGFPVIQDLSNDELDLALGRSHVIHAALVAGAGSDGFLNRWHRYRYLSRHRRRSDWPRRRRPANPRL